MKHLRLVLAVTCSMVVLLPHAIAAQDTPSGGGGSATSSLLPADDLAAAAAHFDEALLAAEAAETGRAMPATSTVGNAFDCDDIMDYPKRAIEVAARFRDPWERDLAIVRSLYASLLTIAAGYGGLAEFDRDFAGRMSQLEQAYAVGPSNQVLQVIEWFDVPEDDHGKAGFQIMEHVVPLVTIPGQGENARPGTDPRNLEALRTWGLHIASDLASRVFTEKKYHLVNGIIRLGQAGGDAIGVTPDIADKLDVALRFRVKMDLALSSGSLGVPTNATATLESADLRLEPSTLVSLAPLAVKFKGDGTITENGGVIAHGGGSKYSMPTLSVPTKVTLVLEPCARSGREGEYAKIKIDARPWGASESVTLTKKGRSMTMSYPGTGMWDSAMRTALLRSADGPQVEIGDGQATVTDSASLGYTEGDVSVDITASVEVTDVGTDPGSGGGAP